MSLLRRFGRRLLRTLRGSPVRLVYHTGYASPFIGHPMDPERARKIVAFLAEEALIGLADLYRPRPASLRAMRRVHTDAWIEALDDPEAVSTALGVPVDDARRQAAVDLQRLHAGGTLRATRMALRTGKTVANLGGGFHHATPDKGMGFCLLNDIAMAVAHCRAYGFEGRVLVVDLDLHDGNGTRAAFAEDPTVHTLSIHNADWEPAGGVASTAVALGPDVGDEEYLRAVRDTVPGLLAEHRPDLVIYVAGTDPAVDDRMGNWGISADGLLTRDRLVTEFVRDAGDAPMVVVLGGGYGRDTWRHTARFAGWLATGRVVDPPRDLSLVIDRFRRAGGLGREVKEEEDNWGLTEADLFAIAPGAVRSRRVLDTVSRYAVELSLERVGLLDAVRARGFTAPTIDLDATSGAGDTIRLYGDAERRRLLMELRMTRSRSVVPDFEVLYVEWLMLQDPRKEFGGREARLPGQEHPGLGIMREVVGWLVVVCESLDLDGLAFTPSEFYMAVLGRHHLRFVDPEAQARFDALYAAVRHLPLSDAAAVIAEGRVVDAKGEPAPWEPAVAVVPVSPALWAYVGERPMLPTDTYRLSKK